MVAVEGEVRAVGGNLVACQKRRIIRIIPGAGFKLGEVILAGLATAEERPEEGAGRIVLYIDLDANGPKSCWRISSSSSRHRLLAVVEYWNSSLCPSLLRMPSGPLTQPCVSSNWFAAAGSNLGQAASGW